MIGLKREIDQIAKDKGIDPKEIIGALEEAMKQAARREQGQDKEIEATFNDELGEVELYGLRPARRGEIEIEVTFEIDTNGIVIVTARDKETGMAQATRIAVTAGYSPDDVSALLEKGL